MGKRGPKPKGKVKIRWSSDFAYAIGLIVTDGNLSQPKQGSRISFVSKDIEQIENFKKCLGIDTKIGAHNSGSSADKSYRVQFKDVSFYIFLNSIGIFPAKSKTIAGIRIPKKYFFDYLRGCFDGDGSIYSYWDKRWKSSFMFYVSFISASKNHIDWLQDEIYKHLLIKGHITKDGKGSTLQLKYAKADSLKIINKMYKGKRVTCLSRKKLKIIKILAIVGKSIRSY